MTSADDVDRSKPHPDVFDAALRAGAIDRERAVAVGDSLWDVQAAGHAACRCWPLESGGTSAADLPRRRRGPRVRRRQPDGGELSTPTTIDRLGDGAAMPAMASWPTGRVLQQAAVNRALDPPA